MPETKQTWPGTLELDVQVVGGYPCVRLTGESECFGAQLLDELFHRLIDSGYTRIIVDTRDVRFLDSHCYAALVALVAALEDEGGSLVIVDPCLPVERTLKLLSIERLAHVVPSISQATAYLTQHG